MVSPIDRAGRCLRPAQGLSGAPLAEPAQTARLELPCAKLQAFEGALERGRAALLVRQAQLAACRTCGQQAQAAADSAELLRELASLLLRAR